MTGGKIGYASQLHQSVKVLRIDFILPDDKIPHQGVVNDARRLPHVTERFAQRGRRVLSNVKAIKQDRSLIRFG